MEQSMITVQVKLFATLRRQCPDLGIGEAMTVELPEGATVEELVKHLQLPEGAVKVVFVNNAVRKPDDPLSDGDEVGIFPPVGGG
jgi:molybdopterin converting factor small subunit